MSQLHIAIASDHAGFEAKELLKGEFPELDWLDVGTDSNERVDYPDYANKLCEVLLSGHGGPKVGVLICGTGIGMSMAANRHPAIRAAHVCKVEEAKLAKQHNNANVLCLGARTSTPSERAELLQSWLDAEFEGGRHLDRVQKLS